MGLVGSLEDLGLGDILQIVSLARKSGVLNLSSGETKGKIIFKDGLVITALSSEIKKNLGLLLVEDKVISQKHLEEALAEAKQKGERGFIIKDFLSDKFNIPRMKVDQTIEKEVKEVVFSFFGWEEGNFSFELMEIEDEINSLKNPWRQFVLDNGLSPQYLAMEGTRLQDERKRMESGPAVGPLPGEPGFEIKDEEFKEERLSREEDFGSVSEFLEQYEKERKESQKLEAQPAVGPKSESNVIVFPYQAQASSETRVESPAENQASVAESARAEELENAPSGPLLIAVDDEALMLEAIARHFQGVGFAVEKFSESGSALERIRKLRGLDKVPIVIADLIMPGLDEKTVLGGLELLRELKKLDARIPVILTTDYENQPAQKQAEKLGANYFFFKPKSSQLDETFSSPELINFLQILENALKTIPRLTAEVKARAEEKADTDELFDLAEELRKELGDDDFFIPEPEVRKSRGLEMLRSMIQELNDPSSNGQMTLLVLRFASELMSRAAIFVVTKEYVAGLGQFGIQLDGKDPERQVRKMRIPLGEPSIFQEVIQKRIPLKKKLKPNKWNQYLIEKLGGITPKEVFVAPIVTSGKVAAILYGDNAPEDKEIGDTESLEIFLVQVGLAMEKALLERRLMEMKREESEREKRAD